MLSGNVGLLLVGAVVVTLAESGRWRAAAATHGVARTAVAEVATTLGALLAVGWLLGVR